MVWFKFENISHKVRVILCLSKQKLHKQHNQIILIGRLYALCLSSNCKIFESLWLLDYEER